jgi:glutathione peroxidase
MKAYHLIAATVLLAGFAATGTGEDTKVSGPLDFTLKDIDGKDVDLSKYKGKVILLVNVASQCGYTKQYEGLQDLYEKHEKEGLVVIGIPSNEFGGQEPGTEAEIKKFCTTKYKVTFPMMSKVMVNGTHQVPLYKYLTSKDTDPHFSGDIGWNFEKFLIGRDGKVVGRFKSAVAPSDEKLVKAIKAELDKPAK